MISYLPKDLFQEPEENMGLFNNVNKENLAVDMWGKIEHLNVLNEMLFWIDSHVLFTPLPSVTDPLPSQPEIRNDFVVSDQNLNARLSEKNRNERDIFQEITTKSPGAQQCKQPYIYIFYNLYLLILF